MRTFKPKAVSVCLITLDSFCFFFFLAWICEITLIGCRLSIALHQKGLLPSLALPWYLILSLGSAQFLYLMPNSNFLVIFFVALMIKCTFFSHRSWPQLPLFSWIHFMASSMGWWFPSVLEINDAFGRQRTKGEGFLLFCPLSTAMQQWISS